MSTAHYTHTNSKGVKYYLNTKVVILRGNKSQVIYYFSKKPNESTACGLPEGFEVAENVRNGFLFLRKVR